MNRYIAAGVLLDMHEGRRVVVISESRSLVRQAFAEVAAHELAEKASVRRAYGEERIRPECGPGWVRFAIPGPGLRGLSADVVVLNMAYPGRDVVEDALRVVAASPTGEVIRL